MKPCPVPLEDLYLDEDDWLRSRTLEDAEEHLVHDEFLREYGGLREAFYEWCCHPCEHDYGCLCDEWISNWAGVAHFNMLVEELDGYSKYPLLSDLLPDSNDGTYPVEKAAATLAELDRFLEEVMDMKMWVLEDAATNEGVWPSTDGGYFIWMCCDRQYVGMRGDKVFFEEPGGSVVETSHFRQIPRGLPEHDGCTEMDILCLDIGERTWAFDSIGPGEEPKIEREFIVVQRVAPFLYEGKYGVGERIRKLLVASLETGNPIRWS